MKRSLPWWLVLIAVLQIIPLMAFPPETLKSLGQWITNVPDGLVPRVVWGLSWLVPVGILGLVGWGLLRSRAWARTSTVFLQGFSVIVRLLALLPGAVAVASKSEGDISVHASFIISCVVSMSLSTVILLLVDRPEVTAALR